MSQQRAMPPALPPLLRVPLMWGLPLVCAPGQEGVELQEELLDEWQVWRGKERSGDMSQNRGAHLRLKRRNV